MYIYFEDWSTFLGEVHVKGFPPSKTTIKVFALPQNPANLLHRESLTVVESDGQPFKREEQFSYDGRKTYNGTDLESHLNKYGLPEEAKQYVRALFRFANQPELGFCQEMMDVKYKGEWLIQHPFEIVDYLTPNLSQHPERANSLHLDIFTARSLDTVTRYLGDIDWLEGFRAIKEGTYMRRRLQEEKEGTRGIER